MAPGQRRANATSWRGRGGCRKVSVNQKEEMPRLRSQKGRGLCRTRSSRASSLVSPWRVVASSNGYTLGNPSAAGLGEHQAHCGERACHGGCAQDTGTRGVRPRDAEGLTLLGAHRLPTGAEERREGHRGQLIAPLGGSPVRRRGGALLLCGDSPVRSLGDRAA